jgi:hypothetical protein
MYLENESLISNPTTEEKTKLKPSQAIRIGASLRPQCVGYLFADGGSCALGAMYEGFTGKTCYLPREMRKYFPEFSNWHELIINKNDIQKWTREQIADWLEAQGL